MEPSVESVIQWTIDKLSKGPDQSVDKQTAEAVWHLEQALEWFTGKHPNLAIED